MSEIRFLPMTVVIQRTGLSRATVYRLIQKGEFPKQCALSEGRVGWSSSELEEWIQGRLGGGSDDLRD